jgi:hypothetical protein
MEARNIVPNPASMATGDRQVAQKTQPEQPLPAIQEDTEEKDQSSEGQKDIVLVKTFYVR